MGRSRGKFLSAMIVIWALLAIASVYEVAQPGAALATYQTVPNWFSLYSAVSLVATGIALVGLWLLQRWAVYLFWATFLGTFAIEFFVFGFKEIAGFVFYSSLVAGALWFWAITRKWGHFA